MKATTSHFGLVIAAAIASLTMTPATAQTSAAPAASAPAERAGTDKAGKPPVDAAASKSGVATKKPAKAGAQGGPASAPTK